MNEIKFPKSPAEGKTVRRAHLWGQAFFMNSSVLSDYHIQDNFEQILIVDILISILNTVTLLR